MKLVVTDANGLPAAFYDADIHGDVPKGAVKITDEQWQEFIDNPGLRRLVDGAVAPYEPPPPEPVKLTKLHKATLWRRLSDSEADTLDAALAVAPTRLRRIFESAQYLDTSDPDYPALRAGIEEAIGLVRAKAILQPDH